MHHNRDQAVHSADRRAGTRRTPTPPPRAGGPREALVALQRQAGNAAVVRVMRALRADVVEEPVVAQRSLVHDVLRSGGKPLDADVRHDMETQLGADFSSVRLHSGPLARRSAAAIGARAYTSGENVVVGDGGADRHSLVHELTHVIQQRQGPVAGTDHGDGLSISDPSDRFEREAEANAHRVMRQRTP
jgi:hypothetical protein